MSSRHTRSFFGVMLAVVFALSAVIVAPASAKLTKHQKAHIRHQLMRSIKKNPKLIRSKSFIKKASLVDFTLPITIKLRTSGNGTPQGAGNNPNSAILDLGASLGQREVDLGGKLGGEIQFHDSFDGGALGNVDLVLNSGPKSLTSTSIPLLWNPDVSDPTKAWDTGLATANALTGGCGNFTGAANLPFDPSNLSGLGGPFVGVPVRGPLPSTAPNGSFVPVNPGIDDINNLSPSKTPGNLNNLGGQVNPFPAAPLGPTPSYKDAVLRTAPLNLQVASPGTVVNQSTGATGPNGSQDIVIGKSGGQANLFGSIPGKSYGIDVTVSLATKINSILRAVDVDAQPVFANGLWPAALFNCRQAITGYVQNYIPDIHLKGNLKISPAITPSGDLRIAKASLSQLAEPYPTHFAVAACLSPYSVLAAEQNGTNNTTYPVPNLPGSGTLPNGSLPADTASYSRVNAANVPTNPDFTAAGVCDSAQTQLTKDANFAGLTNASAANGYSSFSTTSDGSKVSVGADLTAVTVEADVLIGDR